MKNLTVNNSVAPAPATSDCARQRTSTDPPAVARIIVKIAAIVLILGIYSYPSLRTRAALGPTVLPQMFAPDLTLYLNLGSIKALNQTEVLNPYYPVPVANNGTAYLKFRLAAVLFNRLDELLGGRTWHALFIWNLFWWGALCIVAVFVFKRFLPASPPGIVVVGLMLLMLFNFGITRTLLAAWVHLPAFSAFQKIGLPYMRSFNPQIPVVLLLGYLGLQMEALRRGRFFIYVAMGILQLFSLVTFPYGTLMMVGLTCVSVLWQVFFSVQHRAWLAPLIYGCICAVVDSVFLLHGSLTFYGNHSSPFHFQPQLLPHLVGGNWLVMFLLTVTVVFSRTLAAEVRWPLVGLGVANLALMLGDAVVPATTLLLSAHASYFVHLTIAVLLTFLVSAILSHSRDGSRKVNLVVGIAAGVIILNGLLLSVGTYRGFLPYNREQVEVVRLLSSMRLQTGDLVIARSRNVDDPCGWVALLSKRQVLFCTDAGVMLTPQQDRDIHRFRQALYLYFSGKDSSYLQGVLTDPNATGLMYQLGYWAEGASFSREEQQEGLHAIQTDLIPRLEHVENHDAAVNGFLRQFRRIIVIDNLQNLTFSPSRLAAFLELTEEQHVGNLVVLSYAPH